jgi:hypothetical protein
MIGPVAAQQLRDRRSARVGRSTPQVEGLSKGTEWASPLERTSGPNHHRDAMLVRGLDGAAQKPRLADPRFALNQHRGARPRRDAANEAVENAELRCPPDHRAREGHPMLLDCALTIDGRPTSQLSMPITQVQHLGIVDGGVSVGCNRLTTRVAQWK